ncbi:MAG: hypothetical protein IIC55_00795, partial [Proteobacteria bacterium]|nr:hypothetical protein [Pseudomonadota bacterium]
TKKTKEKGKDAERLDNQFDVYVQKFIKDYELNATQKEAALSILREIKARSAAFRRAKKDNIEALQAALADADNLQGAETRTLFEIDSFARLNLADIHMIQGDLDTAKGYLETVYQNAGKDVYFMAQTRWKPRCLITLGEIWLRLEKPKKTEAFLAELEAQGYTELFPFKKHQVRANRLRGALLLSQGQPEDAEAEVKLALERALQLENPTEIWKSHQALGDLYKERGKAKLAKTQYRNAVKVIEGIANGLTNPELREGFLQSKPIRELFAQSKGV